LNGLRDVLGLNSVIIFFEDSNYLGINLYGHDILRSNNFSIANQLCYNNYGIDNLFYLSGISIPCKKLIQLEVASNLKLISPKELRCNVYSYVEALKGCRPAIRM